LKLNLGDFKALFLRFCRFVAGVLGQRSNFRDSTMLGLAICPNVAIKEMSSGEG
jgi:hypothetical protein